MTEAQRRRHKKHYLKMLKEGRCVNCGKPDNLTRQGRARCAICNERAHHKYPRIRTEEERERENADKRDWAHMRKEAHLCIDCGRKDARTLNGKSQCLQCAKKRADRKRETWNFDHEKELREARRDRWKAAGLCTNCGHPKEEPDRAMCITCRVRAKYRKARLHAERGILPRGVNGKCYQCNRVPALEGKKLCPDCYQKKLEVIRAVIAKRKEPKT